MLMFTRGLHARRTSWRSLTGIGAAIAASAALFPIAVHSAAADGPTPVTIGHAVGVPAGDYLLTVNGLIGAAATYGDVAQQVNGTGAVLRNGDFAATTTARTVTEQVRIAGPSDIFSIVTRSAALSWTSATLTPATWGFLTRGPSITSPNSTNVIWHGVNVLTTTLSGDITRLFASYPRTTSVRFTLNEECWDPFFTTAEKQSTCTQFNTATLTGAPAYQAAVANLVNEVTSTGRTVILGVDQAGRDASTWIPGTQADLFG